MSGIIILVAIVGVITVATLYLQVPAALVFFSLLVGQLLAEQMSDDVYYFVGSIISPGSDNWIKPILLLLPVMLTLLFLRGLVNKKKMLLDLGPALLTGFTAALLLVPLVPALGAALAGSDIWSTVELYKGLIIFAASLASLVTCWVTFSKLRRP